VAEGRVTDAGLAIAALVDAAGAALVVADVAGAADVAGGGEAVETDAVIEWADAVNRQSVATSKLRFMGTPFIVAAARIRGPGCQVRRSRR